MAVHGVKAVSPMAVMLSTCLVELIYVRHAQTFGFAQLGLDVISITAELEVDQVLEVLEPRADVKV